MWYGLNRESKTMKTIYLHKYALSSGKISEVEGEESDGLFRPSQNSEYRYTFFHTPDYSLTLEDALKAAEDKRFKKIKSLLKQIEKLEKLRFV